MRAVASHNALPSRKLQRSLVHFDPVLDVVGHGLQFAVDFAYAPRPLSLAMTQQNLIACTVLYYAACKEPSPIDDPSVPAIALLTRLLKAIFC